MGAGHQKCLQVPLLFLQIATQAGVLNVPQWYESGKIYAEAHPEVPQREPSTYLTLRLP